ncbi:MAG TPA: hypothetical protein VE196_11845 [Pseudonocardiaceae bacterium]|nr:hypothetical protein [Pseudonocardiaceae bacterium]
MLIRVGVAPSHHVEIVDVVPQAVRQQWRTAEQHEVVAVEIALDQMESDGE